MYRALRHLMITNIAFAIAMCFSFSASGSSLPVMPGQALTLLSDGRILATGGFDASGKAMPDAYVVDVDGSSSKLSVGLASARGNHTATALPDGKVLIFGGTNGSSEYVRAMEIFDPETLQFANWTGRLLMPRAGHTATVLTDGRLVVIGGTGEGGVFANDIQFWDYQTGGIQARHLSPNVPRRGHLANLLPDGRVLLNGGIDPNGRKIAADEVFDATANSFSTASTQALSAADNNGEFVVSGSIPQNDNTAFPIQDVISIRFSHLLDVRSASTSDLRLEDSSGNLVPGSLVSVEKGRLLFFRPNNALEPGRDYRLSIGGLTDVNGVGLQAALLSFHTAGGIESGIGDNWIPSDAALAGNWNSGTGQSPWQNLPPLKAKTGVTALSGQVLGLSGLPLSRVTLRIETEQTTSDKTGRFLLTGISAGHHVLVIDGISANRDQAVYGLYEVGVDVKTGTTNILGYTIWMTKLDTQNAVQIPSPTTSQDTVITTPRIPGLELHIPANTTIVDRDGHRVTSLTITPIPLDKPPFPLPTGVQVPVYFTIQPGGAEIDVDSPGTGAKGARLYYPNTYKEPPGTLYNFWNYDATSKGWYIYGTGHVGPDWKQIVPDSGVVIYELTGAMVGGSGAEPGYSPSDSDYEADPVDLSTGEFIYQKTDLAISDTVPIRFTRTYMSNDHYQRPFGIGTTDNYDMFIVGNTNPFTYIELVLPTGSRIRFNNIRSDGSYSDGWYVSSSKRGPWYGAHMFYAANGNWVIWRRDGSSFQFPYSQNQNDQLNQALIWMSDRYGNTVTVARDLYNHQRLSGVGSSDGRGITFQYDSSNRIIQAQDNSGRIVQYAYDTGGHLWKVTDANGGVTTYTYNANDQMTTIQDARGITYLTNSYDAFGRVLQQSFIDGSSYSFNWTPSNNSSQLWSSSSPMINRYSPTDYEGYTGLISQVKVTDQRGYVHEATFNNFGMRTGDIFALGQPEQQSFSYQYYADNLISATTDALGRTTTMDYDSLGNQTRVTLLSGTSSPVTSTFAWDQTFSNLLWSTDPVGNTTAFAYDSYGSLASVTDPLGHTWTYVSNAQGQMLSKTDPLNNTTAFSYSGPDVSSVTDPLGNVTHLAADPVGRLVSVTDALNNQTTFSRDPFNEVLAVSDALGNQTQFQYDKNGNLKSVTDALNHTTSYNYDNMDRLQTRTDPMLRQETYTYDLGGNVATFQDRKGQLSSYAFDGLGRLSSAQFGIQGGTSQSSMAYSYDAGSRLSQVVDSAFGTMTRGYDLLDRLTNESGPQGAVGYTYDNAGRRLTMLVAGQPQVVYGWDNASRLLSIAQGANAVAFTYDTANRRSTLSLPNGVVASYSYDSDSHLNGISYALGSTPIGNLNYTYNSLGHLTGLTGTLATMNLPQPVASTTYDAANELTNLGGVSISYDADGNLTNDGIHSYSWNARNELVSIDSGGAATFSYDPLGRRSNKTIPGAVSAGYLYDGSNPVQELSGTSPSANLMEAGIDEYFARADATGLYSFLRNSSGSTLALTDSNGNIQTQYTYDPFGETMQSGPTTSSSFAYTGRELDTAGLYFNRARYFSPAMGRFISEDPAGFAGGSSNLYSYALDSPTNLSDSLGNNPWQLVGAGGGGTFIVVSQFIPGWDVAVDGALVAGAIGLGAVAISKDLANDVANVLPIADTMGPDPGRKPQRDRNCLYHYTNEEGMKGILKSQQLNPSTRQLNPADVRYGNGQYLSDIEPGTMSPNQLSRHFLNLPFQGSRFTHYVGIDTQGLNVIQGRPGVFVIPNEGPLDLTNRICDNGEVP